VRNWPQPLRPQSQIAQRLTTTWPGTFRFHSRCPTPSALTLEPTAVFVRNGTGRHHGDSGTRPIMKRSIRRTSTALLDPTTDARTTHTYKPFGARYSCRTDGPSESGTENSRVNSNPSHTRQRIPTSSQLTEASDRHSDSIQGAPAAPRLACEHNRL
jgi:hypothetical protein